MPGCTRDFFFFCCDIDDNTSTYAPATTAQRAAYCYAALPVSGKILRKLVICEAILSYPCFNSLNVSAVPPLSGCVSSARERYCFLMRLKSVVGAICNM